MKKIVIATKNKKKLKEIKRLFKGTKIKTLSLNNFAKAPDVIEDKKGFRGNAVKKARVVSRFCGFPALADDSGLEVNALGGLPGVKSARYAGEEKSDKNNNLKLLSELEKKSAYKRQAQFRCVVAIADRGRLLEVVEGRCKGRIGYEMKGTSGFGYDPVFIPSGHKKSFAQLGSRFKDRLSHRAKALKKAKKAIQKYL